MNVYNNIYLGAQREQLSLAVDGAICSGVKGEMSKIYFPRVRSSGGLRAFQAASASLFISFTPLFAFNLVEIYIKTSAPIIYAPFARAQWTQQRRNAFFLRVCINKKILMAPFLLPFQQ
jgi:hypothetical protein